MFKKLPLMWVFYLLIVSTVFSVVVTVLTVIGTAHGQSAPDLRACTNGFATIFGLPTRLSRGIGTPHETHGIRLYLCDRGTRVDYRFNPRDLTLTRTDEFRCDGGRCP